MIRLASMVAAIVLALHIGSTAAFAQAPGLIERGAKVYAAERCSTCHSIAGKGNTRGALDKVGATLSADEIRQWIVAAPEMTEKAKATRKPLMKAYPNLPKDDLEALVAYLQSLKG
jgi:mono/diheme cytochrome c family protein